MTTRQLLALADHARARAEVLWCRWWRLKRAGRPSAARAFAAYDAAWGRYCAYCMQIAEQQGRVEEAA